MSPVIMWATAASTSSDGRRARVAGLDALGLGDEQVVARCAARRGASRRGRGRGRPRWPARRPGRARPPRRRARARGRAAPAWAKSDAASSSAAGARLVVGAQVRGALERRGAAPLSPPRARASRAAAPARRRPLVGRDGRLGQVPGAARGLGGQLGERRVHAAPRDGVGGVVDRRAQQRVGEVDAAVDADQAGAQRGLERVGGQPAALAARCRKRSWRPGLHRGGDQQRLARGLGQLGDLRRERVLEPVARAAPGRSAARGRRAGRRDSTRGISVSASGLPCAVGDERRRDVVGDAARRLAAQQLGRGRVVQAVRAPASSTPAKASSTPRPAPRRRTAARRPRPAVGGRRRSPRRASRRRASARRRRRRAAGAPRPRRPAG